MRDTRTLLGFLTGLVLMAAAGTPSGAGQRPGFPAASTPLAAAEANRPSAAGSRMRATCPCLETLYNFGAGTDDGINPRATLTYLNGLLYGTTSASSGKGYGSVFSISPGGAERVLHTFGSGADGADPRYGTLLNVNGVLYGTTGAGGASGKGTIFSITPSGVESVVYNFGAGTDGDEPAAGLISVDGLLYGTTAFGGTSGNGTVFGITPGGKEAVLYSLPFADAIPYSPLLHAFGALYGTSYTGGGYGTVFRITSAGRLETVHRFGGGNDGRGPFAGLVELDGVLYGTTSQGGASGGGTVFSITAAGVEKTVYAFTNDLTLPDASALLAQGGVLYGTTKGGESNNSHAALPGTVYSVTPSGVETTLYTFPFPRRGSDIADSYGGLAAVNGLLYGTTPFDGATDQGTFFSLNP